MCKLYIGQYHLKIYTRLHTKPPHKNVHAYTLIHKNSHTHICIKKY